MRLKQNPMCYRARRGWLVNKYTFYTTYNNNNNDGNGMML